MTPISTSFSHWLADFYVLATVLLALAGPFAAAPVAHADPAPAGTPVHLTLPAPHGPHQVVVDAATAKRESLHVGDPIGVAADGPTRPYRIVGIATYGGVETLGGATIAAFDLPTARALLHKRGYDAISVAARPGVGTAELLGALRPIVPATAQVTTGSAYAQEQAQGVDTFITFIRWFLLAFGVWSWFIWITFVKNLWNDGSGLAFDDAGDPTAYFWVHLLLAVTSFVLGTVIGVLGLRGVRASRKPAGA